MTTGQLDDVERDSLEFERLHWKYAGARAGAILDRFDMTETRYLQKLLALIDRPEALAYDAQTVKRLQRLRDGRRAER